MGATLTPGCAGAAAGLPVLTQEAALPAAPRTYTCTACNPETESQGS